MLGKDEPQNHTIIVCDFGTFSINSRECDYSVSRRKSHALLTVLATLPNFCESRERLAELLWSEVDYQSSRVSLRQELKRLRDVTKHDGEALIEGDKFRIWLTRPDIILLSKKVVAALTVSEISEELLNFAFPQERLFAHLQGISEELDMWIAVERSAFERQCVDGLKSILVHANETNNVAIYEKALIALLNFDPTNETAVIQLIDSYGSRGAKSLGQALFQSYQQLMKQDYQLEPSSEVEEAYSRLFVKKVDHQIPERGLTTKPVSHAVLSTARPLILSRPLKVEVCSDISRHRLSAMRTELLGILARFRDWSIRDIGFDEFNASEDPSLRAFELQFVADDLDDVIGFGLVLRRLPEQEILWTERVEIDSNVFSARLKSIVKELAAALNLEISAKRLQDIMLVPDDDLTQYDLWLKGQSYLASWKIEDEHKAEQSFRTILSRWPEYAPAMMGLVEILNTRHHVFPGIMPDKKRISEAMGLAQKAARLSPTDSRIQLALAWTHLMAHNRSQAMTYFEMVLKLNEYDPHALISVAMGMCYAGNKIDAQRLAEISLQLAGGAVPIHWAYHACIRFHLEDIEGAEEACQHASDATPFMGGIRIAVCGLQNDKRKAAEEITGYKAALNNNWYATKKLSNKTIREWLLRGFPICMLADRERLDKAFDAAGFM